MDFYGFLFGVWFGVGCYRLFEMFRLDAINLKEGLDPAEEFDVSPIAYHFWTIISAFGWPIFMPLAYFTDDDEDEE
jgi:hypothetical protein